MRKILLLPVIILMAFQCEKSEFNQGGNCIQVSYVAGICGEAVLQIISPEYKSLGESWNGNESVFFTVLPCGTEPGDLESAPFFVQLESFEVEDCIRCKATIGYTGEKRYKIRIAEKCS
jgi:hypothetical protein